MRVRKYCMGGNVCTRNISYTGQWKLLLSQVLKFIHEKVTDMHDRHTKGTGTREVSAQIFVQN